MRLADLAALAYLIAIAGWPFVATYRGYVASVVGANLMFGESPWHTTGHPQAQALYRHALIKAFVMFALRGAVAVYFLTNARQIASFIDRALR